MPIPVTVFTGFLGSGKTTIILNLIKALPQNYKMVLLKNEFGNIAVDSKLANESNLAVTEMLNGCLCCILVGKLGNALEEIMSKYQPDRIIIETSGSAYPAPIVWELKKLGEDRLKLDGVVTVIDALNFEGYKDTSYTAKLQAQYTDLILINKHESVAEHDLEHVLDDVYELNATTAKIKTDKGFVDPKLIFGLDSKLYELLKTNPEPEPDKHHHHNEVEIIEYKTDKEFSSSNIAAILSGLPKWDFYRIKGTMKLDGKWQILNYAFGKYELVPIKTPQEQAEIVFMGKNFNYHLPKLRQEFNATTSEMDVLH